jgi:hypothetical protein
MAILEEHIGGRPPVNILTLVLAGIDGDIIRI